jgi:hypothetical protein
MSGLQFSEACGNALKQMDRSSVEGPNDAALLEHLSACAACCAEFEARKKLRGRLRSAVQKDSAPPFLQERIRRQIRSTAPRASWSGRLSAVAAGLVICLGVGIAYQLGHLRLTTNSQESYIASVSNRIATIMRVGLRDHIHCAVFRKYPKDAPKVEELSQKLGAEYSGLVGIAQKHVPADYRLMIAHQCRYHGRQYVHLALKNDARLVSLVIARKGDGESFETEKLVPALSQAGILYYGSGVQRFQIAALESRDYLVYLISDLPQQKNMEMMVALGLDVRNFLQNL